MSKYLKYLPFAFPLLLYIAYLNLYNQHILFGIEIKYWISLDEFLVLFFEDIARFSLDLFFLAGVAYIGWRFKRYLYNANVKASMRRTGIAILVIYFVSAVAFWMVFYTPTSETESLVNIFQATVFCVMMTAILCFEKPIEKMLNIKVKIHGILIAVVLVMLLSYAATSSSVKYNIFQKTVSAGQYAKFCLKDGIEKDSLLFVGGTKSYYFLTTTHNETYVIERSRVDHIEIFEQKRKFIIYN